MRFEFLTFQNFFLDITIFKTCSVRWLLEVWKGNVKLPNVEEMKKESEKVCGVGSPDIPRHFHKMGPTQWVYNDILAAEGGFEPIPRAIQELYTKVHKTRAAEGPVTYRDADYDNMDAYDGRLPSEF